MNRALERVHEHNTKDEVADALQLLKLSVQQCSELGDAWYYRALFEKQLAMDAIAKHSLKQAELVGSTAMQQNLDPFTLSTPVSGGEALTGKVRDKWALVVGIGQFQDAAVPPLTYTAQDAADFAKLLANRHEGRFQPDHIHLLKDAQATTVEVRKELNWLAEMAQPDDLVVIFISSHGSAREADTANVSYILTYDTNVASKSDLYATALPMVEVSDVVRSRIKALRAVVFLDTCHSGAASQGLKDSTASGQVLDRIREGSGRAIVASAGVDESSQESETLGHGYFTFNLLHALALDDGMEPVSKVYDYLRTTVPAQVYAEKHQKQTPVMTRSDRGADIVIGVRTGS
jgi:uncharacterized caspase-like protein